MADVTREELVELLDTVFGVTDKFRKLSDHYVYEGGMNPVEDLLELLSKWAVRLGYYKEEEGVKNDGRN